MLTLDTAQLERQKKQVAVERHRQEVTEWVADQTRLAVDLDDPTNPCNVAYQMGKEMLVEDLERRLKKLNPNLQFIVHPERSWIKCVYKVDRIGRHYLTSFNNEKMPEHSIRAMKTEDVRDTSVWHVDRKDLPKHEWDGEKWVFDKSSPQPGMERVNLVWWEAFRGWRTILLQLVKVGALTPSQVEREFGADNRPEWAGHLGKQALVTKW